MENVKAQILFDYIDDEKSLLKTIDNMNVAEKQSLKDSNFLNFVNKNFGGLNSILDKIRAVHNWVFFNIKYTEDSFDETIISPRLIIYILKGDCDDMALFIKTALKAMGIETNYILLAKTKNNYSHIAVVYYDNGKYYYIDGTQWRSSYPENYKYYKII